MEGLLKSLLFDSLYGVVFAMVFIATIIFGVIKKTKNMENKKTKCTLRIVIITLTIILLLWLTVFGKLGFYTVSMACYEYENNITEKADGVVDRITRDRQCVCIYIDNVRYKIPNSSKNPLIDFEKGLEKYIKEGDHINLVYGKQSKIIFEFEKME